MTEHAKDSLAQLTVAVFICAVCGLFLWARVSVDAASDAACKTACAPFAWSGWQSGDAGCWCKTPDPTVLRQVRP